MKRLSEDGVLENIRDKVIEECRRRGISGVLVVVDLTDESSSDTIRCSLIDRVSPLRIGVPDKKDANFLCEALAKIAMVAVYLQDTGCETTVFGEVPFQGGRISADGNFGYAFSGATQEVDAEIVKFAEQEHAKL